MPDGCDSQTAIVIWHWCSFWNYSGSDGNCADISRSRWRSLSLARIGATNPILAPSNFMNKIWRKCLLSWQIPSIGFGLTFILGLGFSYSNQNIRSEVQSVGLVVFTVLVAVGHIGGTARTPIYEGSHTRGSPNWKSTQASSAIGFRQIRIWW